MVSKSSWYSCFLFWFWWYWDGRFMHILLLHASILPWSYRSHSLNLLCTFFSRQALTKLPRMTLNLPSFCLSLSSHWGYRPETSIWTCYFFWSKATYVKSVFPFNLTQLLLAPLNWNRHAEGMDVVMATASWSPSFTYPSALFRAITTHIPGSSQKLFLLFLLHSVIQHTDCL